MKEDEKNNIEQLNENGIPLSAERVAPCLSLLQNTGFKNFN